MPFIVDFIQWNTEAVTKKVLAEKSCISLDIPFRHEQSNGNRYRFNGITILLYTLEISLKDKNFNLVCATIEILILLLQRTRQQDTVLYSNILYSLFTYNKLRSTLYEEKILAAD